MTLQIFLRNHLQLRIIRTWGFVSFLFIVIIKGIIRPMNIELSKCGTLLQGILPNFFASTGYTAIVFLLSTYVLYKKKNKLFITKTLIFAILFSFSGLFIWEYLQYFIWRYPVDYFDIIASAVGAALTGIFIFFISKQLKVNVFQKA